MKARGLASTAIYALSALAGVLAFTYPFILPSLGLAAGGAGTAPLPADVRQTDAPLLTTALIILALAVLLIEVQGQAVSAKVVAALGMMVALTSVLRFIEVAIPGPGGFSLVFAPIILSGYIFGPRFGFLLGTLALLVSALVTGNVGPWMPYQMFTAGWIGLSAGWLPRPERAGMQLFMLAAFSFAWGFLFGAIMNLYFWPFIADGGETGWQPGTTLGDGIRRYFAFYLATSLLWDIGRAAGNAFLVFVLGIPTVRALSRFRDRFEFHVV